MEIEANVIDKDKLEMASRQTVLLLAAAQPRSPLSETLLGRPQPPRGGANSAVSSTARLVCFWLIHQFGRSVQIVMSGV